MKRIVIALVSFFAVSAHAATFSVTTTNDSGVGSLRQAIVDANASNGLDTVAFSIPGLGPHTITPDTALPTVTDPVIIDGYTQANSSPNTLSNGCNAVLMIELNASTAGAGLHITAGNSTIRGLVINRNLASDLAGAGILMETLGSNVVEGCFLGTDVTGSLASPNTAGVSAYGTSDGNLIGGTSPAARNVVSGNNGNGVFLRSSTNSVLGNFIGVDRTGTNALANTGNGVYLQFNSTGGFPGSVGNRIGGDIPGSANIIAANGIDGILIDQDGTAMETQIKGNFIGTDFSGTVNLGNQITGIWFDTLINAGRTHSVVGDTTPNVIAFNGEHGVRLGSAELNLVARNIIYSNTLTGIRVPLYLGANSNNTLSANSIFNNGKLGIALEDETTPLPNDPCDPDTGSNLRQNYPVLTAATSTVNSVTIAGFLASAPSTAFDLEFFANTVCDPSGFGEGEFFIGTTNVTTGADCTNNFTVTFPTFVADDMLITATATDPTGNTSEFSQCLTNQTAIIITVDCALSPPLATNTVNTAHTVTATITTNSSPASGVLVNFSVTAGPNVGQAGTATTSVSGQGSFTYTGSAVSGTDTIFAVSTVAGGSSTCTATKVWLSEPPTNQPPVAICQSVTTNAGANCQVSLVASNFDGGSFDNDGTITSRVIDLTGPFTKGVQQVVLTVTDNSGASSSCTTTVTVVDNTAPSISCPSDIISNVAAGVTNTIVTFSPPTVADNCSGVSTNIVPPSGSTFNLGTNTVTCTAVDTSGNTNTCTFSVIVTDTPPVPHDLGIVSIKPPKTINLKSDGPAVTKRVKVQIQNLSAHSETVSNLTELANLVSVTLSNLHTGCTPPDAVLIQDSPNKVPKTIKPNGKLTVSFNVTFSTNCVPDAAKGDGHQDFSYTAHVNHAALDGNADTTPSNDVCPRPPNPAIGDKGCGAKNPDKTLGADVLTDVTVK